MKKLELWPGNNNQLHLNFYDSENGNDVFLTIHKDGLVTRKIYHTNGEDVNEVDLYEELKDLLTRELFE